MKTAITVAALLAILISALECSGGDNSYPAPPADARAESFAVETRPFEIGSETYKADFGTITVPENRSNPASRLITIPFLRIRTNAVNSAEPVFGLAGGPGASNMSWDWGKAWTVLHEHDFVLVGYRGVDGSTALTCPEVKEALQESDEPLSDESMKSIAAAWNASGERLRAQGIDLDGYSMPECIEDNESVRRVLGYDRVDLLSESYGTRVAYLYGLRHPEHVFRSAMIGVNPPGHFVWEARTTDAQLRLYAALWAKDSLMSAMTPDLYGTVTNVLTTMPRRWLLFSIDPGKVKVVTFALLFHRRTAAQVFDSFVAASHGDASGLALMSLAYDYVVPSLNVWGDLASKAVSADYDSTRDYCTAADSAGFPLGAPMTRLLWGPLSFSRWPIRQIPEELRTLQRSDVSTLLLSGSVDFSAPAEFATQELLPYLSNGRQVILAECGHVNDVWYAKPENTRLILTSFYNTGEPNTSMNSYIPMDFSVGWGFPAIAKFVLGVGVVLGLILIAAIAWLVRRLRKSPAHTHSHHGRGAQVWRLTIGHYIKTVREISWVRKIQRKLL